MRHAFVSAVLLAAIASMGCGQSTVGRACTSTNPCPSSFVCSAAADHVNRCTNPCNMSTETVCHDGRVCLPVGPMGTGACYLGGPVALGQACTSDLDCARSGVCIRSALSGATRCFEGCNLDGTYNCLSGARCMAAGSTGFCAS